MEDLESLMIYKQYVELVYYTLSIVLKYPKSERFSLAQDIKNVTYSGLNNIVYAQKTFQKEERLSYLNELDANLKILKVLVRISKKKKYITAKNYLAWSKKITNISNLNGGWIRSCVMYHKKSQN